MSVRAISAIKNLSSSLGDSSEEAGSHLSVLLESIVSMLGSAWVQVSKEKKRGVKKRESRG